MLVMPHPYVGFQVEWQSQSFLRELKTGTVLSFVPRGVSILEMLPPDAFSYAGNVNESKVKCQRNVIRWDRILVKVPTQAFSTGYMYYCPRPEDVRLV